MNSRRCVVNDGECIKSDVIVEGLIPDEPNVVKKKLCGEKEGLITGIPPLMICHVRAIYIPMRKRTKARSETPAIAALLAIGGCVIQV